MPRPPDPHATVAVGGSVIARELAAIGGTHHAPAVRATPPLVAHPAVRTPVVLPDLSPAPLDRYELLGEIARGGMGVVLRARDTLIGREIAVKLLRPDLVGDPAAERRFVREAQVTGQLQHPGVVPVYDVGRFPDGRPFLTMRLARGRTLDALLAARRHPGSDRPGFVRVFERVCETIAYAHAKGVIHRDLKPLNVVASGFGQVRVLDWGLACLKDEGGRMKDESGPEPGSFSSFILPPSSFAGGTPAFLPPEQAHGRADERSDVFGLGGLLCAILTGSPPFAGGPGEAWAKAAAGDVGDAHRRLAACGANRRLVRLAVRCLAADPARRPANAAAVSDELHAAGRWAVARWFGR